MRASVDSLMLLAPCLTIDAEKQAYNDLLDQLHLLDRSLEVLKEKPAVTQDGFQVKLLINGPQSYVGAILLF